MTVREDRAERRADTPHRALSPCSSDLSPVRQLRLARGLTAADVQRQTGVAVKTLAQFELGVRNPHAATVAAVASRYGVSAAVLGQLHDMARALTTPHATQPVRGRSRAGIGCPLATALTTAEVAARLQVSVDTVAIWSRTGKLTPFHDCQDRLRYLESSLGLQEDKED